MNFENEGGFGHVDEQEQGPPGERGCRSTGKDLDTRLGKDSKANLRSVDFIG